MIIFNEERTAYYRAKKRELARKKEADLVIKEDALFIKYYGMSAYLELFPEAKYFGVSWHRSVVEELRNMERRQIGQLLSGIYSASAATKGKKANRKFRRIIKDLTR
jgi:hypothetical protein